MALCCFMSFILSSTHLDELLSIVFNIIYMRMKVTTPLPPREREREIEGE